MSSEKQYQERSAIELDRAGGYYFRHLMAMTTEGLHSKSDIACELGYRDMRIDQLQALNAELVEALRPFAAVAEKLERCNGHENRGDEQPVWGVDGAWLTLGHFRVAAKAHGVQP